MAQYSNLKAYIEEKIYENGTQAITGDILQDVLKVMTDDLGEFYQTGGVASPSTDPGTPDAKVIYIATEAGTYTNFGGITIEAGEVALLIFETSWTKETLNVLSSANGGVKTANLADGAVTTEKIAGGAVETAKIANNAVTSGKVADGAIGTAKIADGAIDADKIAANAVESAKIKNGAVTEGKINDGAVTAGKIASNAVTTAKIKDDAVTTAKLNDGAVTEDKIATDAVTSGKVKDGAIGTAKIAAGAVTHAKIGAGAVEESNIKDGAVTSDKIANGAVGSDQLAEGAFSAENLADGSVTTDKLADEAVTAEKIADGAVTAGKFANGSVTTIKLGSGAVTTEKIGDGMVTRQKLADSSVGTSKIIDGAVTTDKVADGAITDAKLENPVSVSQNSQTGHTDITIGDTTTPVASAEEVEELDLDINGGTTTVQIEVSSNYPNQYFSGNDATVGAFYDLSPLALQGTMGYKIAVAAGDKYIIYGLGETQALPLCVITDSSHIVTQIIKENSRANGRTVEIQESGTLFINLYNYNASTDKVLKEATILVEGLVSKVSNLESKTAVLKTKEKNKKILFLSDSNFTNELTGVVDYYATDQVDTTKEYYLKICGYRNNNKNQTIIQIVDGNGTTVEQVQWNASVSKVYKVNCAGFVFLIDSATLPVNSIDGFIIYNLHLNKYVQNGLSFDKEFIEDISVSALRWLKKPFASNIYETKVLDSLISISAKTEIPDGLYIRYFNRRTENTRQLFVQICDNNDTEVSRFFGTLDDINVETTIVTTGTYIFEIKVIATNTVIDSAFTDFKNYNLKLDATYLNSQIVGTIVCFGDSITMFKGTGDKNYPDWLQEYSKARVFGCGFGGTRLTSRTTPVTTPTNETEAFAPFDISNLIDFICNNDYTKLDAGLQWIVNNEGQWLSSQYTANLANVKAIDWADVDTVIFFAGTNDKSAGASIGVASDDNKTTVMGAVKLITRLLLTAYPHIKVYWFTPIIRYYCDTVEERTPETFSDATNLPDYVDAIIQQSTNLKLPVCDLYRTLGWNPYNFSEYFQDNDGTHPYKGFKQLAMKIYKFIQSN